MLATVAIGLIYTLDIGSSRTVGMLESCVAPILILIISMFYTKKEQASRYLPTLY